jgi:hypothetical protein
VSRSHAAILTLACLLVLSAPSAARAASSGAAPAAISATATHAGAHVTKLSTKSNGNCSAGQMLLNALNPFSSCQPLNQAVNAGVKTIAGIPGTVTGWVATGIMDQVTSWMVGAAQTITGWVFKEAAVITKPELDARWYLSLFSGLAALGAALAGLVALIALGSAALRRDPDALGEVVYGIGRAGIGTSIVVALTIIALTAADAIANGFAHQMPADFYKTLASQWGGSGWGGFGAAALAFLVAFVATIAGLLVWLELIVREAAIYIAVLFFPVALAASIWPALRMWVRRLGMVLLMFVMLRPVVVIVLALAGSVTSAGLSFGDGSIPHSVGTILAGVVIFALAAFTPWSLMFLVGTEIGVMYSRGSSTSGAGGGARARGTREGRVGGALASGPLLSGEPELAAAGAGGGAGSTSGGAGGGLRLSSLGGSGSNGGASPGPIAAAGGWMAGVGGTAARLGGQLSQHAAARIQVAAGRSGVAPNGLLPVGELGFDGSGEHHAGTPSSEPPPRNGARPDGTPSFAESLSGPTPPPATAAETPEPPSSVDSAVAPSPPDTANTAAPNDLSPSPEAQLNAADPPRGDAGSSDQKRGDR